MPIYETIAYTRHARERMDERRIHREDVELALRVGEGRPGKQGTWIFEAGPLRVIVREQNGTAIVITVMRLKGKR